VLAAPNLSGRSAGTAWWFPFVGRMRVRSNLE